MIAHADYPYRVETSDPMPVMAHVWLKNNNIDYWSAYTLVVQPEISKLEVFFKNSKDASWFALNWAI